MLTSTALYKLYTYLESSEYKLTCAWALAYCVQQFAMLNVSSHGTLSSVISGHYTLRSADAHTGPHQVH